jgi:hypothetical protein
MSLPRPGRPGFAGTGRVSRPAHQFVKKILFTASRQRLGSSWVQGFHGCLRERELRLRVYFPSPQSFASDSHLERYSKDPHGLVAK